MPDRRRQAYDRFACEPTVRTLRILVEQRKLTWADVDPLLAEQWARLARRLGRLPGRQTRLREYKRLRAKRRARR